MTSPVDTSVKFFTSSMPGAPVLSGSVGSLIPILDACLINGFGLKTVDSIVVASNIATMNFSTGHSFIADSVALISGATPAALNGEQKIISTTSTTATFATTGISNQTATGTITAKLAPAGWLKPFSGTNLAVYQSADPQSTKMFLRVDDTPAQFARVRGFETMSDVNTGTGPFPTDGQSSGGGYWNKNTVANGTAVRWYVVSDGRFFIYANASRSTTNAANTQRTPRGFGDIKEFKLAGDPFGCLLNCSISAGTTSQWDYALSKAIASIGFYMPRQASGFGTGVSVSLANYGGAGQFSGAGNTNLLGDFPSTLDGKMRVCSQYVLDAPGQPPRGDIPGTGYVLHSNTGTSFVDDSITPGTGGLYGKRFLNLIAQDSDPSAAPTVNGSGIYLIDVVGPWR